VSDKQSATCLSSKLTHVHAGSSSRCQSVELRASRDTSKPSTIPARPIPTSATSSGNLAVDAEAPDRPRSLSMTMTWSLGPANATARWRRRTGAGVLSVFSKNLSDRRLPHVQIMRRVLRWLA